MAAALNATDSPFNQIVWITGSASARLLAKLVGRGETLTHDLLDDLPLDRNVHYVRQLLVHSGALPERNEDLERLPRWLEDKLADVPADHANLVRPFAHWHLLRRARVRAASRKHPAATGSVLRRRVTVALNFLAWLDARQIPLGHLQQDDLDRWLEADNRSTHYEIRYFLKWAGARRLTRQLTVPIIPAAEPTDLLDDCERWDLVRECLTEDTKPIDVRAAGTLILLFGLTLERIRHLTADQITQDDEHTYLAVGRHPILLPPRLARLLLCLAAEPGGQPPTIAHGLRGPHHLFPGRVPGQPISASALSIRLTSNGITARRARNTALISLATDLPAAILADLLGMHIHTAIRWTTYGQHNWSRYLSVRDADQAATALVEPNTEAPDETKEGRA
ncbi:hypothetical protein [Actinomadura sp. CNU-125]|uniref:hypothetical protein n=1 Tax=Actinomadura sp. CNU-125 TaxID=1904961 RepID=UPI00096A7A1C|nr:hypothetical protein [Actinomadura sp. CNU-125]